MVTTRADLFAAGWSENSLRAHLDARRWQALNDVVICRHNGPLTREQAMRAAVLSAQGPAAVCARTALEQWAVTGVECAALHVLVARGHRVLPVAGIELVVHESRRFGDQDVWPVHRGVPVTGLARSAVDAAAWSPTPLEACRVIAAVVQQRRARPYELSVELANAGSVRHCRTLRQLLADLDGGAQALSEVEFLRFCRRHGFPPPALNKRDDSTGRVRYLDAVFVGPTGEVVRVEIDGGVHLSLTQRSRDTLRDNDASLQRQLTLRYASVAIYTDDPQAVRQLREALRRIGLARA